METQDTLNDIKRILMFEETPEKKLASYFRDKAKEQREIGFSSGFFSGVFFVVILVLIIMVIKFI